MGELLDINAKGLERGKIAANLGDAHEHIVAGILIRLGFDVGIVDVSGTPYDLIIVGSDKPSGGKQVMLKAQIKTAGGSIGFTGGSRGGVDRTYKSSEKTYKYTTEHSELILGIDKKTLDIYVIPTKFIARWGKSRATSKMQPLKNNWDIFLNWNDSYLAELEQRLAPSSARR